MWVFATQGLSSASNFALTLFVLASATPHEFGSFSIGITSYMLIVQLSRTGLSLPLLVLYSGREPSAVSAATRPALALTVLTGCVAAIPFVIGALVYREARSAFIILAASLPFLLYQDVVRHIAIARAEPRLAAASDGIWFLLQLLGSAVAIVASYRSPTVLLLVWAAAGTVSGAALGWHLGARPALQGINEWLRTHRSLFSRMLAEFGLTSGSFYALSYGLAILAGPEQLGRLRAAQALIGPVSVLVLGGVVLGVPESVRVRHDKAALRRFAVHLSAFLAAASVLGGVASYVALPTIGPRLFPAIWSFARPLIPVLTIYSASVGISIGALSALRALDGNRWIVTARAWTAGFVIVLGFPLSVTSGAGGAIVTLAIVETAFAFCAWTRFVLISFPEQTTSL